MFCGVVGPAALCRNACALGLPNRPTCSAFGGLSEGGRTFALCCSPRTCGLSLGSPLVQSMCRGSLLRRRVPAPVCSTRHRRRARGPGLGQGRWLGSSSHCPGACRCPLAPHAMPPSAANEEPRTENSFDSTGSWAPSGFASASSSPAGGSRRCRRSRIGRRGGARCVGSNTRPCPRGGSGGHCVPCCQRWPSPCTCKCSPRG
mmetsp:Transcript_83530/g.194219  ORF Transcript_83530/g.194219 Transcript_83530/m.194219 type:complete len:203 (+) Transcript_83530:161-769(+)